MSVAFSHISFRFSPNELQKLDKVVAWERSKGPMLSPPMQANRTSVIKALIERELIRLDDEADRTHQSLEKAKVEARRQHDRMAEFPETPGQRKTRLQRERRAAKRELSA